MSTNATTPPQPPRDDRNEQREAARRERWELLEHLQNLLEPFMVALGLVFLVLLLIDFSGVDLTPGQRGWLNRAQTTIWGVFLIDFAIRFIVAPSKLRFLQANWLSALSLALPFLRPLRAFRALRALRAARAARSLSLVRLLGGINRGMRVLRQVTRGRQFAYLAALSALVILAGALGVTYFDRGVEGAMIDDFGDALWWSATLITTMNVGYEAVSTEARIIGFLLRIYALSVFGYVTATIATYFIGKQAEEQAEVAPPAPTAADLAVVQEQLAALQRELALLRQDLGAGHVERNGSDATGRAGLIAEARTGGEPPR